MRIPRPIFVQVLAALLALPAAIAGRGSHAAVEPDVLAAEARRVEVIDRASRAAVAIMAPGGQGGGSGVLISADGYALSNFHVTHEAGDTMKCGLSDGRLYDAVIVGLDPTGDVALIKLLGRKDFPYAEMGDSDRIRPGDWCLVIGNPFLLATNLKPTVTYGVISGVHRYQYPAGTLLEYTDCLQTDASINPGNSGGPMFDGDGRLIGINGRGSFEKRGRVNVGVGYAISINQIKNFLGDLRSGRIVDHATLGAVVSGDEQGAAMVDDILEHSDAFRRGLRYGDQIVRFAGRRITSPNSLKTVLGIFPDGWRLPLTFRRQGTTHTVSVRLRSLHPQGELREMVQGTRKEKGGKLPGQPPDGAPPRDKKRPQDNPRPHEDRPRDPKVPSADKQPNKEPMPKVVKEHYTAKPGFANYYFNKLEQERVFKALAAHGDNAQLERPWTLRGELQTGGDVLIRLDNNRAAYKTPGGEIELKLDGSLSESLEPAGSGGLTVALAMWHRLLTAGPAGFTPLEYRGIAPLLGRRELHDVVTAALADVECRFYFEPSEGQLAAMEMTADPDTDPCEIYFEDYRDVQGRVLPHRFVVRHGDTIYQVIDIARYSFGEQTR